MNYPVAALSLVLLAAPAFRGDLPIFLYEKAELDGTPPTVPETGYGSEGEGRLERASATAAAPRATSTPPPG